MPDVRLIDANALPMHKVKIVHAFGIVEGSVVFPDDIKKAQTIDAVPVVHGRVVWKNRFMGGFVPDVTITDKEGEKHTGTLDTTHYEPVPYCSVCGKELGVSSLAYCPNCGAKMDGGAEG